MLEPFDISISETSKGGENEMKLIQKLMMVIALLGSLAMATPAKAGEWGCRRYHHYHCYHHYGCWRPYVCYDHYGGWHHYGCWHHHRHCW